MERRKHSETAGRRPEPGEMQALFDRYQFAPAPECPPELLESHRLLVFYLLRAFSSDTRPPAALLTAVVEWYRRYDELADAQPTEQVFERAGQRVHLRLACVSGCNHCCRSPVSVIAPEAALIGEYVRTRFTAPQRAALDARMRARSEAVGDDRDRNHLCPLNVDGKCTVYVVRPLNCRKFHSFDEAACRQAFVADDNTAAIPRAGVRGDASGLVWQSVVAAFAALKIDTAELDFMPALAIALREQRVPARLAAGERVFTAARR